MYCRYSPEGSVKLSKSSARWYFLYPRAHCNIARKINMNNTSIKIDAVARKPGSQEIHCSIDVVEFISKGDDVLLFSYILSENQCSDFMIKFKKKKKNAARSCFIFFLMLTLKKKLKNAYETCSRVLENHPRRFHRRHSTRRWQTPRANFDPTKLWFSQKVHLCYIRYPLKVPRSSNLRHVRVNIVPDKETGLDPSVIVSSNLIVPAYIVNKMYLILREHTIAKRVWRNV